MGARPELINGTHEGVLGLVEDKLGGMPSRASVQHVKDDVLMDK